MNDILIIGAGAAGMTAALYALRNGKSVTIIERDTIGGQIASSPKVENFPTILSTSGQELADKMFEQITSHGAEFKFGEVISLEKINNIFVATTEFEKIEAKSVVIAAGVEHRKLNLENEDALIGHGISYCALCDGAFYEGEDVSLIGDGNTALQYALLLSSYCKSVHIYTLFDKFFADEVLIKALKTKENILVTHEVELTKLVGNDTLTGLEFKRKDGTVLSVDTKALFVAIGQVPNNKIYSKLVDLDSQGYIVANEDSTTKTTGLFVAGDCRTKKVRQLTTACSDGAMAATVACNYLQLINE